jgi:lysophospholipase L1-like esterase/phosphohistidine phosphatase SixA
MMRLIRTFWLFLLLAFPLRGEEVSTVILVRHAEKMSASNDDVPLSEAGHGRAKELARVLAGTKIDAIYTTQWQRTKQTAEPVARAKGITPVVVESGKTHADEIVKRVRGGQTTLVVGHSNSTPEVIRALGVADPPAITDSEYDNLFIVTLAGGKAKLVSLRYGAPSVRPARFLALGDSYTIGEAVAPAERWPNVLAEELKIGEPQIIARTGWTTDELNAAIDAAAPQGPFDLVTLLIGVNNQYRGRDAEEYRREFKALLGRAAGFAGGDAGKVIVLSIPDWGVTPFAEGRDRGKIAAEIDRFNAINGQEARSAGARYVDVTAISRESDRALVAGDGLHPSARQYRRWAGLVLPEARAVLGR